jgi:hypothetical protein
MEIGIEEHGYEIWMRKYKLKNNNISKFGLPIGRLMIYSYMPQHMPPYKLVTWFLQNHYLKFRYRVRHSALPVHSLLVDFRLITYG